MARRLLAALLIAGATVSWVAAPAMAQGAKDKAPAKAAAPAKTAPAGSKDDPVVALINGAAIHRSDVLAFEATLPPQTRQTPFGQLYPRMLDQLVANELALQAARKSRVGDNPDVKKQLARAQDQVLEDAYFSSFMKTEITEAKLRARYDQTVKNAPAHDEISARHILVPTEDEAKAVIEQLKKGADFATLAKEKTTDPAGKASGGDLGFFSEQDMLPDFAKAAFALKKGEFSQTPVHTQFGWHVIKVEDRRPAKPPTYEQAAPQIAHQMQQDIVNAKLKELASAAKIEVFNADGTRPTPAAPAAGAAPGAAPVASGGAPAAGPGLAPLNTGAPGGAAPGAPTLAPATRDLGK